MIYFLINVFMYLIMLLGLIWYFKNKINITSFLILLFNMNIYFIFIMKDINFIYGLSCLIISIILYYLFNIASDNKKEVVLIKDGNINFHEIINHYSLSKLITYLKIRHIRLDEVAYCIKNNNQLSIIKSDTIKSLPVSIIVDGNVMTENLALIHKNYDWLRDELLNKHLLIKNVNYAYYKNNKIFFIEN